MRFITSAQITTLCVFLGAVAAACGAPDRAQLEEEARESCLAFLNSVATCTSGRSCVADRTTRSDAELQAEIDCNLCSADEAHCIDHVLTVEGTCPCVGLP